MRDICNLSNNNIIARLVFHRARPKKQGGVVSIAHNCCHDSNPPARARAREGNNE